MVTKKIIILLFALGLCACGSVSTAPLDDAYYWDDSSQPTNPNSPSLPGDSIEYLNVQDTVVTVRIKK